MKNNIVKKFMKLINVSLKVDANTTSTIAAYQPKVPKNLNAFKKNDK